MVSVLLNYACASKSPAYRDIIPRVDISRTRFPLRPSSRGRPTSSRPMSQARTCSTSQSPTVLRPRLDCPPSPSQPPARVPQLPRYLKLCSVSPLGVVLQDLTVFLRPVSSSSSRILRTKRNRDGPRFYPWKEGSCEFLHPASGRHPNIRVPLVESPFLRSSNTGGRRQRLRAHAPAVTKLHPDVSTPSIGAALFQRLTTQTNGLTATRLHLSRMFRSIWPLHRMCCSTQNSQNRAHRSGIAVSFPLPSGEHQTTTLRTRVHLTRSKNKRITNLSWTTVSEPGAIRAPEATAFPTLLPRAPLLALGIFRISHVAACLARTLRAAAFLARLGLTFPCAFLPSVPLPSPCPQSTVPRKMTQCATIEAPLDSSALHLYLLASASSSSPLRSA